VLLGHHTKYYKVNKVNQKSTAMMSTRSKSARQLRAHISSIRAKQVFKLYFQNMIFKQHVHRVYVASKRKHECV
jgi:hypothetical protein